MKSHDIHAQRANALANAILHTVCVFPGGVYISASCCVSDAQGSVRDDCLNKCKYVLWCQKLRWRPNLMAKRSGATSTAVRSPWQIFLLDTRCRFRRLRKLYPIPLKNALPLRQRLSALTFLFSRHNETDVLPHEQSAPSPPNFRLPSSPPRVITFSGSMSISTTNNTTTIQDCDI